MIKIKAEGQITHHGRLAQGANFLLEEYERKISDDGRGTFYFLLGSIMFSAFRAEGCINVVGWRLLREAWPDSLGWRDKIKLIYGIAKKEADFSRRPLQTVSSLFSARNDWAHAKPEIVNAIYSRQTLDWPEDDPFVSQLVRNVTIEFAKRCEKDVDTFFEDLLQVSQVELVDTLTSGTETGLQ